MKKRILIAFIAISASSFCQEYNFKPKWTKGDVKQITITQVEREYEDGELISDTITYNETRIKVLKDNKEDYILEILMENLALSATIGFYDKLGEELKNYKELKLIYAVNKETGKSELQNWEEAQKFMNNSFEQITKVLEDKSPEFAPFVGMVFLPIKESFKSKENIEAYMETNIGYLLTPFKNKYTIGEVITLTESQESPFNPMQEVSSTTKLSLESLSEKSKTCTFKQEVELDLSEFIEMMKGMMEKMAEAFGANDSISDKKSKEMDDFEMDIENIQLITFNYETSWVTKVVATSKVTGTDPRKGIKTKAEVVITTVVK